MNDGQEFSNVNRSFGHGTDVKQIDVGFQIDSLVFERSRVAFARRIDSDGCHVYAHLRQFLACPFGRLGFLWAFSVVHVGRFFERFLCSFQSWKRFVLGTRKSGDLGVGLVPVRIDARLVSSPDNIKLFLLGQSDLTS